MRPGWTLVVVTLLAPGLVPTGQAASAEVVGELPVPANLSGPTNGLVGATAVYHQGTTYVFGGRMVVNDGEVSDRVYAYDHATGASREVGRLPVATGTTTAGRFSAAGAVLGDQIYLFGGAVFVQADLGDGPTRVPKSIRDVVVFTPATGDIAVSPAQLPAGLWGHSAASDGQKAWLFGGFTFDIAAPDQIARRDWIVEFSPASGATRLDARLPFPLQDSGATLLGGRAYVFGGLGENENSTNRCPDFTYEDEETGETRTAQQRICAAETILAWDPGAGAVEVLPAKLPYRAQFLHAAVAGGKAYVAGGRLQDGSASASIVEFAPGAVSPVRVLHPTLPYGFFAAPATSDGATVTIFGGRLSSITDMTPNVVRVDPRATAPWAPRSLAARAEGANVTLTWEPPAYDGDAAVTGYRVYRAEVGAGETFLGVAASPAFQDATPARNAEYVYRVTAVNAVGEGAGARASTLASAVPPGPVASLAAYAGNGEVLLRWTPPADDGGSPLTGHRVYRDGALAQSFTSQTTEWLDRNVTNGVSYSYVVRAVNAMGEGPSGAPQVAAPQNVPAPPTDVEATVGPAGVTITWSAPAAGTRTLALLRGEAPASLDPVRSLPATTTTFVDETVERGRTWYYAVAAANDVGQGPPSEVASVTLVDKPGAPTGLVATPLDRAVRLAWEAPEATGVTDPTLVTYSVKRDGRVVGSAIRGTAFTDAGLEPGRAYEYTVAAFNGLDSDDSKPVTGSPRSADNQAPVAIAAVLTSVVRAGEPVTIDGSQSSDPDGFIEQYAWDYGDGSPVQRTGSPTARHAYAANGTYTVRLVVVDDREAESVAAKATVIVGAISGRTPEDGVSSPPPQDGRPGTGKTQPIPAPGLGLVVLVAAALAALQRRRA